MKVEITSNANNTGRFFLKATRPGCTQYDDIVIGDFFSVRELQRIVNAINNHLDLEERN